MDLRNSLNVVRNSSRGQSREVKQQTSMIHNQSFGKISKENDIPRTRHSVKSRVYIVKLINELTQNRCTQTGNKTKEEQEWRDKQRQHNGNVNKSNNKFYTRTHAFKEVGQDH